MAKQEPWKVVGRGQGQRPEQGEVGTQPTGVPKRPFCDTLILGIPLRRGDFGPLLRHLFGGGPFEDLSSLPTTKVTIIR